MRSTSCATRRGRASLVPRSNVRKRLRVERLEMRLLLAADPFNLLGIAEGECPADTLPEIEDQAFLVDENSPVGAVIGTVQVANPPANPHFAITAGNASGAILLDEATGIMTVADASQFDFEELPSFEVEVTVSNDCGDTSTGTITVSLNDRNDPADFTLDHASVDEHLLGSPIGTFVVTDQDAEGDYEFHVWHQCFEFVDGMLMLREDTCMHCESDTVTVIVSLLDHGAPLQETTKAFVLQINENPYPWHDDASPFDINCDGDTTPLDALQMINEINRNGSRDLGPRPARPDDPLRMYDVYADECLTALDVLTMFNYFNAPGTANGEGEAAPVAQASPLAQPTSTTLLPLFEPTSLVSSPPVALVSPATFADASGEGVPASSDDLTPWQTANSSREASVVDASTASASQATVATDEVFRSLADELDEVWASVVGLEDLFPS